MQLSLDIALVSTLVVLPRRETAELLSFWEDDLFKRRFSLLAFVFLTSSRIALMAELLLAVFSAGTGKESLSLHDVLKKRTLCMRHGTYRMASRIS
jgi:hypothetical protein